MTTNTFLNLTQSDEYAGYSSGDSMALTDILEASQYSQEYNGTGCQYPHPRIRISNKSNLRIFYHDDHDDDTKGEDDGNGPSRTLVNHPATDYIPSEYSQ